MKYNKTNISIFAITILLLSACKFENIITVGEKGNGNVITEVRHVEPFFEIQVSTAINAIITFNNKELITIETDENLMPLLETEVVNDVLKIGFSKNIRNAKKRTVYINAKKLGNIRASSAANIVVKNLIKTEHLTLASSSAGSIEVEVANDAVNCETSSAGTIKINGETAHFTGKASSGSIINARDLKVKQANIRASSGGSITAFVTEHLTAKASSGGSINYFGNPTQIEKSNSSGGSVSSKD